MEELLKRYSQVQLATLVDAPPEGDQWLHEIKYDGYRLLAFLEQDDVKLYTRNGNEWTGRFPAVRASIAQVKAHSAVLDMHSRLHRTQIFHSEIGSPASAGSCQCALRWPSQ
jgi:bifunctional non-homologous end joining protein LigD